MPVPSATPLVNAKTLDLFSPCQSWPFFTPPGIDAMLLRAILCHSYRAPFCIHRPGGHTIQMRHWRMRVLVLPIICLMV